MKINPSIFKAYDIRGKFPAEINEEIAEKIGLAAARFLSARKKNKKLSVMICRDLRISSKSLKDFLARGLIAFGVDIIDAGEGTTPYFYYLLHILKPDGGIMVTASHNPPEYNGFKIRGRGATPVSAGFGMERIKAWTLKSSTPPKNIPGRVTNLGDEYKEKYLNFISRGADIGSIRAVVDASGGSTAIFLPKLLNKFPELIYKPLFFEPDGTFSKHPLNPLLPQAQEYVKKDLKKGGFQLGAIFDGDGDRVMFFDEKGEVVRAEYIFALFAEERLKKHPGSVFVMTINTSKAVRDFIQEKGGKVKLSPIGAPSILKAMKKYKAVMAVEVAGHYYFKDFFSETIGLYPWLKLASLLSKSKKSFSQLVKPFDTYVSAPSEINFHVKDKKAVMAKVRKVYKRGRISALDGLTVEFPDWWFNLRPSNTEDLVRLTLEAKTQKLFEDKKQEFAKLLIM